MKLRKNNKGIASTTIVVILMAILVVCLGVLAAVLYSNYNSGKKHSTKKEQLADRKDEPTNVPTYTPTIQVTSESTPTPTNSPTPTPTPVKDKTFTLMVYVVGANLETDHGLASKQIKEIMSAKSSENLNIVIQTGGSKKWHMSPIEDKKVQRFTVENNKLVLQEDLGKVSMSKEKTLEDFITWAKKNYPADRYGLCLNNHGGTATNGYGLDEIHGGSLLLNDLDDAIGSPNIHFDFIAFDACTMSTFETAYILSPYADYLVASESVIYSYHGLEYKGFMDMIAADSSVDTLSLCKTMADDLEKANNKLKKSYSEATYTISVTDLSKMKSMYNTMCSFMKELDSYIVNGKTATNVANVRYHTKYYGSPENDFIDIGDFVTRCKIKTSDDVLKALSETVVYSKSDIPVCCGMGMYMPYYSLNYFQRIDKSVLSFITNKYYKDCLYDFANLVAYCREPDNKYYWYSEKLGKACMEYITPVSDTEILEVTKNSDGVYEWVFDKEMSYKLASASDKLYIYVGDTIYYMGKRDVSAQTKGSIKMEFSNDWYALDNVLIPVIYQGTDQKINGSKYTYSYIPAQITKANGTTSKVYLVAYFNYGEQNGKIIGYNLRDTKFDTMQQITLKLEKGDKIGISYLISDNNGEVTDEQYNVLVFNYNGSEIDLKNVKIVADQKYALQKCVTDYFGREYHTNYLKDTTK